MAGLVEFALEAYNARQYEIKLFKDLVNDALEESVKKSKELVGFIIFFNWIKKFSVTKYCVTHALINDSICTH